MREILLPCGVTIQVSDIDFAWVLGKDWTVNGDGQVLGTGPHGNPHRGKALSRYIAERAGMDMSDEIDHEDRKRTNNQRENLRAASGSQNCANKESHGPHGRGVTYYPRNGKYMAWVKVKGRRKHLGYYDTPEQAAGVAQAARQAAFGEFASVD